jgi:hypothetical protein
MKIRKGFVSNSSSSSFTIYGWTEKILSEHAKDIASGLSYVKLEIDEEALVEKIEELWPGENTWDIHSCEDSDGYGVYGVGTAGEEVDHYINNFTNAFKYPEPNAEKKKQLDEIAKTLGLPAPQMYQETFYA